MLEKILFNATNRKKKGMEIMKSKHQKEYEECQDQNNPGWREIHKYNKKLQASSALKQTQLKNRIKT